MSSNLYSKSGVNQKQADTFAGWIAGASNCLKSPNVVSDIGGFAGLYEVPGSKGKQLLVGCTDGVGTKLKLAFALNKHNTIGIDLVAMSVNDLLTTGAAPLFFLDYLAVGKFSGKIARKVVEGVIKGCTESSCALLGGETAQLPDFYSDGEYDLAGFAVGMVERKNLLSAERVKEGDIIMGIPSTGPHSNGYSLIRKIVDDSGHDLKEKIPGLGVLGNALLKPTRIYAPEVRAMLSDSKLKKAVHSMAHITGGGLPGNVPRVLPKGLGARIDISTWKRPKVFDVLAEWGGVSEREMFDVFNMGIGMTVVISAKAEESFRAALGNSKVYKIGEVVKSKKDFEFI